jgi:hypothetical protein
MVILKYNIIEITLKLRKLKCQIYKGNLGFYKNTKGILGRLMKKSLNLNPFLLIPSNFEGNENLEF